MSENSENTMYDFDAITFKDENQKALYTFLESIRTSSLMAQKVLMGELDPSTLWAPTPEAVVINTAINFAHMVSLMSKKNGGDVTGFNFTAKFSDEVPYQEVYFQLHREGKEADPQIHVVPGGSDDK